MSTSAEIQGIIIELLQDGKSHSVQDMKKRLDAVVDAYTEGQFSGSINTLLRNGTLRKQARGVYALHPENMVKRADRLCFVLAPSGTADEAARLHHDRVWKYIISPACQSCGFSVEKLGAEAVTQTLVDKTASAALVIADISEPHPNIFYAAGYRMCTKKPIIYLKRAGRNMTLDLNGAMVLEYDLTDIDSVEIVKNRLRQLMASLTCGNDDILAEEKSRPLLSEILPAVYQMQDQLKHMNVDELRGALKRIEVTTEHIKNMLGGMKPL